MDKNIGDRTKMIRQALLIHPGMQEALVVIVGVGMLGSWTAMSLARTCSHVIGIDFDTVGEENIGTQAYSAISIGDSKTDALAMNLAGLPYLAIDGKLGDDEVSEVLREALTGNERPLVVVSAVDSFAARRLVADFAVQYGAELFIDLRAHGMIGVVVTAPRALLDHYLMGLETDEGTPEPACGAEGTAFVGMWCATEATASINRHFKGMGLTYKLVRDVGMADTLLAEPCGPLLATAEVARAVLLTKTTVQTAAKEAVTQNS